MPEVALQKTREELLTDQFYRWEKRGRGWDLYDFPVELEPPFVPFFFHEAPALPAVDDARKHTLLSVIADKIQTLFKPPPVQSDAASISVEDWPEPEPKAHLADTALCELMLSLPPDQPVSREQMEQLLIAVANLGTLLSFELIGQKNSVRIQLVCEASVQAIVREQLSAYFPEVSVQSTGNYLKKLWDLTESKETEVIEFGLSNEFMRPIRTFKTLEVDPLTSVVAALSRVQEGEIGLVQILFQATRSPWTESILRSVTDWEGTPFFIDAPELVPLSKQKVSRPLFATVLRVAVQSPRSGRAWEMAKSVASALAVFSSPASNELMPLDNDGYDSIQHAEDVVKRRSRRAGMLVNSEELVGLAHLPSGTLRTDKLERRTEKTKAAPPLSLGHRLTLGENHHSGKVNVVTLAPEQRVRHTYVVGASGTGKSTLLLNLIAQDIRNGEGLAVLDPHGDLIDQILGHIPEERFQDVILFDPSDAEYPIGFNILSASSEVEKNVLASDMVSAFKRLSTSWGDQMTSVLGNAILACLERKEPATLLDLRHLLIDSGFRRSFLSSVQDPEVVYYWEKEFSLLSGRPQASILTRLDTFLRPRLIRNIVSQKQNRLNFRAIMDEGKIFLAKLAQGIIGEENSYLLGTLIVSKLHQVAMGRQETSEAERRIFYLYVDEFQNFVTPSMAALLSGARKFRLGLVLAHQELRQLWNRDSDVASAVISNPFTRICFRLGDFDAQKLADGFAYFEAKDLLNLGVGEAIARIERAEFDFNLKTLPLPPVEVAVAKTRRERLLELSRQSYASRRPDVEAEMEKQRGAFSSASDTPFVKPRLAVSKFKPPPAISIVIPVSNGATELKLVKETGETPLLGRGGQDHKNLQQFFKQLAESKGYLATIEKSVLNGTGFIDLALEKDGQKIACEFCVTSTVEQELGNVQKCLAANFGTVIVVAVEKSTLDKIKSLVTNSLDQDALQKVLFYLPDELVSFFNHIEIVDQGEERIVRGRKVKTNYRFVTGPEQTAKKESVLMALYHKGKSLVTRRRSKK